MSKAIHVKPTPKCSTAQSTHIVEYISFSLAEILRFVIRESRTSQRPLGRVRILSSRTYAAN